MDNDLCNKVNEYGKSLSNKARFEIITTLFEGSKNVSEISRQIKLPQPTVSQHLLILKNAHIVTSEKLGNVVIYSLNYDRLIELQELLLETTKRGKAKSEDK